MITVIDYGMGNLRSVVKAVEAFTSDVRISSSPDSLIDSKAIILPGDGAFAMAMRNLNDLGFIEPIKSYIANGGYFLGICLGFQLLFTESEEFGLTKGLDIIKGKVVRFKGEHLKIPHMGWNNVKITGESKFLENIPDMSYFYFIHSFYPEVEDKSWILGEAEYGLKFTCIVGRGNVIATQFHPEKSHKVGLRILENFVKNVID
ncbi:MAG TPA: imidazole glycerol phosphate synthase subunit HisH [Spirochaetota bacterium]|jgi:glutamine amidotransferase|nr:imidazole glycerol phosphate synthase subunit HisH [Spirochaetota bacterium]OQA94819.1 MAG: Imidazole glycerol phosphate synthase subunit HisH 1 [Spirochaetes bacterium ADurb.Bin218]HOK02498.1 imidazole glycerol phosphate synthase subunit HisH [Spirochaetota bacterium]HOK93457.1 imidazole glycerol phosphate synthase subunit HisH [Spirochaetota bacterium]HOV09251.1 imidazole glycerol phosphate synthase subunit HisH [Spirochaetota bacterium]